MHIAKDLVAASATPLVLGILDEGESYGYAILKQVNKLSGGSWSGPTACSTRCCTGWSGLATSTRPGRPHRGAAGARTRITDQGRAELAEQRRQWVAVVDALRGVWSTRRSSRPITALASGAGR